MEMLVRRFTHKIALSLGHDEEQEAVVAYGLLAMLHTAINILLVFLLGLLLGVPGEALVVCLSASLLRKFSGGVHAVAAELCTSIGIVYCAGTAFLVRNVLLSFYHPAVMAVAVAVVYCFAFLAVYYKAPVDSPNKPIKSEQKIRRMRRGSYATLTVYLLFSIMFWFLGGSRAWAGSYGISLLFGVAWQAFTLTSFGFAFIGKLNSLYISVRKEAAK